MAGRGRRGKVEGQAGVKFKEPQGRVEGQAGAKIKEPQVGFTLGFAWVSGGFRVGLAGFLACSSDANAGNKRVSPARPINYTILIKGHGDWGRPL